MKKWFCLLLAGALTFSLAACHWGQNPDTLPTETTGAKQTEHQENNKAEFMQTDYPKINEIEYHFVDGVYDDEPAVLMGFRNSSKYTIVSIRLHFKINADASQQELSVFDAFVKSGGLTPEELSKLAPSFYNEMVCDPGERVEGSPCTLFHHQYATDVKQCQLLGLKQAHISFQGDDGQIYTVKYTADNNAYELQDEAKPAKSWTQKAFAKATPVPSTRFITVNRDNNDHYQFTAYDMTFEQYQAYCNRCITAGFTNNTENKGLAFSCTNDNWLTLEIMYHPSMHKVVVAAEDTTNQNLHLVKPYITYSDVDMQGEEFFTAAILDTVDWETLLNKIPATHYEEYPNPYSEPYLNGEPLTATLYRDGKIEELNVYDPRLVRLVNFYHNTLHHSMYASTIEGPSPESIEEREKEGFKLVLTYPPKTGNTKATHYTVTVYSEEIIGIHHSQDEYVKFSGVRHMPLCALYNWLTVFGF